MEQPHGVGAAADAGDRRVGQPALGFLQLLLGFLADHRLEVAHHHRIRVRAGDGADEVVGVRDIGDPVAQRLVHRVLQRGGAGGHRLHLGAQQLHAEHVGLLPLDVGGAHVDGAGQAEQRAHGGGGDAVLAGAGLGDDAGLAHAAGQQDLAHAVVGLVAAGVVQLVALEVDLRAAEVLGQPLGEPQRAGPADVMRQVVLQVGVERRDRPWPRCRRARPPGSAASASRRRSGRRSRRSGRARWGRCAGCSRRVRCSRRALLAGSGSRRWACLVKAKGRRVSASGRGSALSRSG